MSSTTALGGPGEAREAGTYTAFGVRLNDAETALLQRAADIKGWSPSRLIKVAAVDRALHIANTGTVTKFNFKALAADIARVLFEARQVSVANGLSPADHQPVWEPHDPEVDVHVKVEPEELQLARLDEVRRAVLLGGGEFLDMILEHCEAVTARYRPDVPDPIEPPGQARDGE